MGAGRTIRRMFLISIWVLISGGMITLLAAAMRKQKNNHCRDYAITLKGDESKLFADKKDIEQIVLAATKGKIKGQSVSSFNLQQLEQVLEQNTWIDEADLYFDNSDVLHIRVTQREPLARIFTTAGNSYYIDKEMAKIPLSGKRSAAVPVFTGFPEKKILTAKDSSLLNEVKETAAFISGDSFWTSQVAQIDITTERNFEMIPVVGNHIVRLGSGSNIKEKFSRLFIFYKEVAGKSGFDKYKIVDVQYAGQVIGVKTANSPKTDSIQLRLNVEKLIKQTKQQQQAELNESNVIPAEPVAAPSTISKATSPETNRKKSPDPNPRLSATSSSVPDGNGGGQAVSSSSSKPAEKKTTNKDDNKKTEKPKAVMPKKPAAAEDRGYN